MTFTLTGPPPRSHTELTHRVPLADFVAFLAANPGQWALYQTYNAKESANNPCKRGRRRYGDQGYTFTLRRVENGYAVYGKYTPPPLAFANIR